MRSENKNGKRLDKLRFTENHTNPSLANKMHFSLLRVDFATLGDNTILKIDLHESLFVHFRMVMLFDFTLIFKIN